MNQRIVFHGSLAFRVEAKKLKIQKGTTEMGLHPLPINPNISANLPWLLNHRYPGRMLIVGTMPDGNTIMYTSISGRSAGSRNRRYVHNKRNDFVKTAVVDKDQDSGNADLTIYKTQMRSACGGVFVASNGRQTGDCLLRGPLNEVLDEWSYEPDSPNYTPRISARVSFFHEKSHFEMAIHRRVENTCEIMATKPTEIPAGFAILLCTYDDTSNPGIILPSFTGGPMMIRIGPKLMQELRESICEDAQKHLVAQSMRIIPPDGGASSVIIWNKADPH